MGITPTPEIAADVATRIEAMKSALAPWVARHMYLEFAETPRDPSTLWTEPTYARLRRIKTTIHREGLG